MIQVAHLIHTTGIGGVETAAELMSSSTTALGYQVLAFEQIDPAGVSADFAGSGVNSPRTVIEMLIRLHRMSPDVVVSSLWRSVIVGGLNRLWHPHTSWVLFIHNSRYTHLIDRLVHRVAFRFADRILCDSAAALDALVPMPLRSHAEVVCPDSALLHLARGWAGDETGTDNGESRVPQRDSRDVAQPVRLIYWGRAAAQKRLDRSLDLLCALERLRPGGFSLEIIAPSSGLLNSILETAAERGLPVTWHGAATPEEILAHADGARFFLQLSDFEGLAMSVREALALGIIPVVTPVGAIRSYTEDGTNAIHLRVPSSPEMDSSAGGSSEISAEAYARAASRIVATSEDCRRESAMARAARSVSGNDYITEFEAALLSVTGPAPTAEVNGQ
ncbi:Glycosyltransferase involved in cell wall bisynthesis [Brevibacterium sp. 239c]|uniref:glycosyltransferase family 4 protein n=1 Tax=Brevibacterium sp. 239c TaxID=1965356 RepID=UPI000C368DF5|nr:glycosyltransferase family 4 protein [Brevibacterium sp. 239c]SMX82311.1 Glycosyltransferase involved in cell wall bisynthesis [Brevibacterium sp. 239c]